MDLIKRSTNANDAGSTVASGGKNGNLLSWQSTHAEKSCINNSASTTTIISFTCKMCPDPTLGDVTEGAPHTSLVPPPG